MAGPFWADPAFQALVAKARAKIAEGVLPATRGAGCEHGNDPWHPAPCALCGQPIPPGSIWYRLRVSRNVGPEGESVAPRFDPELHDYCQQAWYQAAAPE